jgi:Rieske Fe-S protein
VHIQNVIAAREPSDLAASWVATALPLITAATSAAVNWEEVVVSDTSPTGSESVELPITQPHPGSIAGDSLPNQNAMLVGLRTGTKGRRQRGRLFLPGVAESGQTDGVLTGAQLAAVQAFAQGIVNAYGAGGTETNWRLVVYSPPTPPFKPKAPPPVHTDTLITPVTSQDIDEVIRTQRRRSIGVGS